MTPSVDTLVSDFKLDMESMKSERTAEIYSSGARLTFEEMGVDDPTDVTAADLKRRLMEMNRDGYAQKTISSRYQSLRSFYKYLDRDRPEIDVTDPTENIDTSRYKFLGSPTSEKRRQEGIPHISPDEKEELVANVPEPEIRNRLLIRLLFRTGLRQSEVRMLRTRDLERGEDTHRLKVRSPKTDDTRTVFFKADNRIDALFEEWLDLGRRQSFPTASDSKHLFLTRKSSQFPTGRVNSIVKRAAENAGIQEPVHEAADGETRWRVTAHALRHSYAIQAVRNGIDVTRLALLMGHTRDDGTPNPETTQTYLQFKEESLREAIAENGPGSESPF